MRKQLQQSQSSEEHKAPVTEQDDAVQLELKRIARSGPPSERNSIFWKDRDKSSR